MAKKNKKETIEKTRMIDIFLLDPLKSFILGGFFIFIIAWMVLGQFGWRPFAIFSLVVYFLHIIINWAVGRFIKKLFSAIFKKVFKNY